MRVTGLRVFMSCLVTFSALLGVVSCDRSAPRSEDSGKVSDFTLKDAYGTDYNFNSNARGKVVVLNFWAERCPACKIEIPHLVDLYNDYGNKGLVVIGIDVDGRGGTHLRQAIEQYGINYTLLTGDMRQLSAVINDLGSFRFIPTTYVISRDGVVVDKFSGPKGKEHIEAIVKELL